MEEREETPTLKMPKLDTQLCFALYEASRATIDVYRPLLDEIGITYPQYLVLLILWERGTSSVKEIGHLLHLDSGTLSPLLKRLEAAGFVNRQRRPADERIVDISLTERGYKLQMSVSAIPEKFRCELNLSFDDYTGLLTRLKKLTQLLHNKSMS
jgi:DNA-binding MarR family transcriptional regulator